MSLTAQTCSRVLTSGPRRGERCGRTYYNFGKYCGRCTKMAAESDARQQAKEAEREREDFIARCRLCIEEWMKKHDVDSEATKFFKPSTNIDAISQKIEENKRQIDKIQMDISHLEYFKNIQENHYKDKLSFARQQVIAGYINRCMLNRRLETIDPNEVCGHYNRIFGESNHTGAQVTDVPENSPQLPPTGDVKTIQDRLKTLLLTDNAGDRPE